MKKIFFVEKFIGSKIGNLSIKSDLGTRGPKYRRFVLCDCSCGKMNIEVNFESITRGLCKSCGCLRLSGLRKGEKKHGYSGSKIYNTWTHLIGRCYNENNQDFKNYGGRGVKVDALWKKDFINFLNDVGLPPSSKHTLDRIDVNGDYEKNNVRWASQKEQQNNKRSNHFITFNGETKTRQQWADEKGWHKSVLLHRLGHLKWSIEDALTIPPRCNRSKKSVFEPT